MPKPLSKVAVIDTETTGIDPKAHGLIEIAGAIYVDDVLAERFEFRCAPYSYDDVSAEALEIQDRSLAEILLWPDPGETKRAFETVLGRYVDRYDKTDKMGFCGWNARFDADFVRAWFRKAGDEYFGSWFWNPPMDLMSATMLLVGDSRRKLENFKLATVCKLLSIEPVGDAHDAANDVAMTAALYERLTAKWFAQFRINDEPTGETQRWKSRSTTPRRSSS